MSKEVEWKDVKGFEGVYQVSTHGEVRSLDRYVNSPRATSGKRFAQGGVLAGGIAMGYKIVTLSARDANSHKVKTTKLHRIVAETFIPNVRNRRNVNHIDGNKLNNHVSNLEWCTSQENTLHAIATGLHSPKLPAIDDIQALVVITLLNAGWEQSQIVRTGYCSRSSAKPHCLKSFKKFSHLFERIN